jgi:hypothetical protein
VQIQLIILLISWKKIHQMIDIMKFGKKERRRKKEGENHLCFSSAIFN